MSNRDQSRPGPPAVNRNSAAKLVDMLTADILCKVRVLQSKAAFGQAR